MFQMRFKCFKRVANLQKRVANICTAYVKLNALLIPEKNNMWQVSATVVMSVFVTGTL